MKKNTSTLFLILLGSRWERALSVFDEASFNELVTKIESDALDFAKETERLFGDRCSESTYLDCEETSYDQCLSAYPNEECLTGANYLIPDCSPNEGNAIGEQQCSALYDFSISTARIPATERWALANPAGGQVVEALCSTLGIEDWLQRRRLQDQDYWEDSGVEPRAWYFGSASGAFRIWPARHSKVCDKYDPRIRPWYVAGGSGPKNVILIIDTSGSMDNGDRIGVAKEAAARIVETLTVSDRVTIVPFADTAEAFTDENGYMFRASAKNKAFLLDKIANLTADGSTNFGDAFESAFSVFNRTINSEREVTCNSAILFLTDGENKIGPLEEVTEIVTNRTAEISARLGKPVLLFTYSISETAAVHEYPSQLACEVDKGVWTKISDTREVVDALSSYYRLFALGLGSDANKNFVAWVEPYEFFTGGVLGTTVSVPIYDRTVTPHLFLGVVGVDFSLQAIDNALGGDDEVATRNESVTRVVRQSDASCPPDLNLTKCELQAWSQIFDPDEGPQCGINCTGNDAVQVVEQPCPRAMPYPNNIFRNVDLEGQPYLSRVCCRVGENEPSNECPNASSSGNSSSSTNVVAIVVPVAVVVAALIGAAAWWYFHKQAPSPPQEERRGAPPNINPLFNARASAPPPFVPSGTGARIDLENLEEGPRFAARDAGIDIPREQNVDPNRTAPLAYQPRGTSQAGTMQHQVQHQVNTRDAPPQPMEADHASPAFQASAFDTESSSPSAENLAEYDAAPQRNADPNRLTLPAYQAETGFPDDE